MSSIHESGYKERDLSESGTGRRSVTLFAVIGYDAPDAKEKRPQIRPAHLEHLRPLAEAGRILVAGPFTDGSGSLIVLDAPSREEAWQLVAQDPYVTHGVFARVNVRPFLQVFPSAKAGSAETRSGGTPGRRARRDAR